MDIRELEVQPTRLRLWSERSALEVECPLPGVLRLRHSPCSVEHNFTHPRMPAKRSWAVVQEGAEPLEVRQDGDGSARVQTPLLSLAVQLGKLSWSLRDDSGATIARARRIAGEATPGYPLHAYRSTLELDAPPGEAYLGFGEKFGGLDKRGMRLKFWNTDVMPHHPDTDPLYLSIPFFLGLKDGRAWGLLLDETWRSEVDVALADPASLCWETTGPELDLYLIAGPHPADVLRRYTQLTGRAPLPPLWSLGAQQSRWGYENAQEIRAVIDGYRSRQLPLDCVYLDIDHQDGYRSLTWDGARYPDPTALTREAREQGVRLVPIVDPALLAKPGFPLYDEALRKDLLVRSDRGEVLVGEVWPSPAVFPDFTRPNVQRWWADAHGPFLEAGIAGFWNDMNEPSCFSLEDGDKLLPGNMTVHDPYRAEGKTLPDFARHGARRHLEVHNVYGQAMCQATFDAMRGHAPERRPFVLTRAGYAGIQRFAAVWTGDNSSHWGHLEASIPMLLGLGLSGVPFCGADIPGFLGRASPELFVRWTQLGIFYPLMRNHSAKGSPWQEPWRFGEPALSLARAALERRYQLLPVLYTLMHEAAQTGLPPMRPLAFHEPESAEALHLTDQFLFGSDLLVAPIVRAGQPRRMVYVPKGRWLSWPNLGVPGDLVEGPTHVIVDAPLDATPCWLREGAAVPLTEPALHTTTAQWSTLTWHVHVGDRVAGRLYEDEGDGDGAHRLTTLSGAVHGGRLVLERKVEGALASTRRTETLALHGVRQKPRSIEGARTHRFEGRTLTLEVSPDWSRIEVEL